MKKQCVKKYQVNPGGYNYHAIDITPRIEEMISNGWLVHSITPITIKLGDSNPTDYVIVVYEKYE